jgi:carbon-monoxide dehydrogenase small subunit
MTISVAMTVNGKSVSGKVEARTLLVQFLREHLGMTGTHVGCDTSQCGACVVHVDGKSIKSCTILAVQAEGAKVTTIEGLAESADKLHPMQEAFRENHALQCGFCTPGMVMSAIDMVKRHNYQLDEATVRRELEGNLCRCTGYHNIVKALPSHGRPTRISCVRRMHMRRSRVSTRRRRRPCPAWSRSSPARTSPTPRSAG